MLISSVSGIRGVFGKDLDPQLIASIGLRFGTYLRGGTVALACDTRTDSLILKDSICSAMVLAGCTVYDLGYSSTPSVFKEVSIRGFDGGVVITASHNPPSWNGVKLILKGGRGVFEKELDEIIGTRQVLGSRQGHVFQRKALYTEILMQTAGQSSASGVRVALDLAGGVGSLFIPPVLNYQGCLIHSLHATPGIFPRLIDPTLDPLVALSHIVKSENCDVGFAYDCDADRLVIVDKEGRKMSGDATLLICLRYFLENTRNRSVAVSVDTSLAAEDLVREYNGTIVYSKVGEGNVVRKLIENNCGAGGEGSSGGYIEPGFVMCRDGVHASIMISRMIKSEGSLSAITSSFRRYHQERRKLEIDRRVGPMILETLATTERDVDLTDGVKIRKSDKSWVLIRSSNTENVMRVSSESESEARSSELLTEYSEKILQLEQTLAKKV